MAKLQTDLREFIELLNSHGVDFLVVGGHAVAFHGHPRFTGDIDLFVRATPENAQRVMDALRDFGFGGIGVVSEDFLEPNWVVQLGRPPARIDLMTSISGVEFDAAWVSRVHAPLDGQPVSFLGWEDLIRNKKAANREKDRADVKKLLAVRGRKERP